MAIALLYCAGVIGMLQVRDKADLGVGDWFHLLLFPLTVPLLLAKDTLTLLWRIRNGN